MNRRQALLAIGGGAAGACFLGAGFGTLGLSMLNSPPDLSLNARTLPAGYRPAVLGVGDFIDESRPHDTTYIPRGRRELNRDGSCVHHSTKNLLMSLGLFKEAEQWRQMYSNGEYSSRHTSRMEQMGLRFAVETGGDARFLDWACGNAGGACRGAGITLIAAHMVNLLDLDPADYERPGAHILNNWSSGADRFDARTARRVTRDWLITDWRRRGGWAFTVVSNRNGEGAPYPPIPYHPPNSPYRS